MKLNRALRRKHALKVANAVVKNHAAAVERKQWGFGFIVTNRMVSITFWRWVWTPWDRRFA